MSTPIDPQLIPPPPPIEDIQQQDYNSHPSNGSVGPVIGVLVAITVLGAISVMIGRICSGKRVMGYGHYNMESWVETKFAVCVDGRIDTFQRPINVARGDVSTLARGNEDVEEEEEKEESGRDTSENG